MITQRLSTLGMKCPRPLIEVHRVMRTLDGGTTIEVRADDPAFRLDIQAWCRRTGHTLIELRSEDAHLVATIQKMEE